MSLSLGPPGRKLKNIPENEPVTGKENERMDQSPDPARGRAYVALLEVAPDQLRNQRAPLDQIAKEMAAWYLLHERCFTRYASP